MSGYEYIGKRIYYIKSSGIVILDTGEMEGWVYPNPHELLNPPLTKKEYDFKIYSELSKYNKEEVDFIDLNWGDFKTEFRECIDYHIDINNKQIIFEYGPKPEAPDVPVTPSIHDKVETLISENAKKDSQIRKLNKINANLVLSDAQKTKEISELQTKIATLEANNNPTI